MKVAVFVDGLARRVVKMAILEEARAFREGVTYGVSIYGGECSVYVLPADEKEMQAAEKVEEVLRVWNVVVEPEEDYMTEAEFHRAYAAVLRRESSSLQALADYDAGRRSTRRRRS